MPSSLTPAHRAPTPLATGFAPPDPDLWQAQAEKTLKGAPLATLTRRSLEDIPVEPFYPARQAATPAPAKAAAGWDIRTLVRDADASAANEAALGDLRGGADSVLLRLDPTGATGVAVGSAEELARVLDGVVLDAADVALDAGFLGAKAADWLAAAAKGAPSARLALHLDPLSAFAEAGASPGPIESHVIAAATVGARLAPVHPRASLFLASGGAAHEAGGGEAAELALAAASALAYVKALVRAGVDPADAFERIVLGLAVDTDVLFSVAKLRAARRVWARIADACGVDAPARIEARSSARMIAKADPWTNMIRLTAAGFAGAVGGADAVVLGAFTDALGPPAEFARRQSRNVQLVLREEAGLGRVIDPAGGAAALEALTDELARGGWAHLQEIEAAGGVVRALETGVVARWVAQTRAEVAARLRGRDLKLLGVTDFRPDAETHVDLAEAASAGASAPSPRLPGPDSVCPALAPIRLEALA
ncbi:MAG TPA: methylmalonyl-CoA mutase family protein [Caulobacteraceae bacterium]|nr:methylmalonyl-CoA mutase family protein [Caulobacteraceae bacterium]